MHSWSDCRCRLLCKQPTARRKRMVPQPHPHPHAPSHLPRPRSQLVMLHWLTTSLWWPAAARRSTTTAHTTTPSYHPSASTAWMRRRPGCDSTPRVAQSAPAPSGGSRATPRAGEWGWGAGGRGRQPGGACWPGLAASPLLLCLAHPSSLCRWEARIGSPGAARRYVYLGLHSTEVRGNALFQGVVKQDSHSSLVPTGGLSCGRWCWRVLFFRGKRFHSVCMSVCLSAGASCPGLR